MHYKRGKSQNDLELFALSSTLLTAQWLWSLFHSSLSGNFIWLPLQWMSMNSKRKLRSPCFLVFSLYLTLLVWCQGDSGGALLAQDRELLGWSAVGIVSYQPGVECGTDNYVVFTEIRSDLRRTGQIDSIIVKTLVQYTVQITSSNNHAVSFKSKPKTQRR